MIQVNLLLPLAGKTPQSFAVMDLMRLPLGILSGMGFIGAGAIVRRDNMVRGVTTAATLWFATVMGLCFGGGQTILGVVALAIAIFVLWPLKWAEHWVGRHRRSALAITTDKADLIEQVILPRLAAAGLSVGGRGISLDTHGSIHTIRCEVRSHEGRNPGAPYAFARELARHPDITYVEWVSLEHQ
jgi:putative Mg2+ transporter-C (MgtC) family protein